MRTKYTIVDMKKIGEMHYNYLLQSYKLKFNFFFFFFYVEQKNKTAIRLRMRRLKRGKSKGRRRRRNLKACLHFHNETRETEKWRKKKHINISSFIICGSPVTCVHLFLLILFIGRNRSFIKCIKKIVM